MIELPITETFIIDGRKTTRTEIWQFRKSTEEEHKIELRRPGFMNWSEPYYIEELHRKYLWALRIAGLIVNGEVRID